MKTKKIFILTLMAVMVLAAGSLWAANLSSSSHQQFAGEKNFRDYGTPDMDNPDYYYAAIKSSPSGISYYGVGFNPLRTKIVANKDDGAGYSEIVMMNADGTGEEVISPGDSGTGDIVGYWVPFWSDDGTAVGFVEIHNSNPNKVIRYDVSSETRSYIYEPVGSDVGNPDFLGNSTSSIVFWDWISADGAADLFTWDGTTLTNITNSTLYSEYEPVSNNDGTIILYWSGETTTEPVNTTHTLTNTGRSWVKDVGFTAIADTYWGFWSGKSNNNIGVVVPSTHDIHVYDNTGSYLFDVTGPGYVGGAAERNYMARSYEGNNGEILFTSNAGRTESGRDIIIANPRDILFVDIATGSDSNPGTIEAPFLTITKAITEAVDGGTVNVAAGTYEETVTIDKCLTLIGAGSGYDTEGDDGDLSDDTVINGGGGVDVLTITASGDNAINRLVIRNIHVTNGNDTGNGLVLVKSTDTISFVTLENIAAVDNNDGIVMGLGRGTSQDTKFEDIVFNDCVASNNANIGINTGGANAIRDIDILDCMVNNNTVAGFQSYQYEGGITGITISGGSYATNGVGDWDMSGVYIGGEFGNCGLNSHFATVDLLPNIFENFDVSNTNRGLFAWVFDDSPITVSGLTGSNLGTEGNYGAVSMLVHDCTLSSGNLNINNCNFSGVTCDTSVGAILVEAFHSSAAAGYGHGTTATVIDPTIEYCSVSNSTVGIALRANAIGIETISGASVTNCSTNVNDVGISIGIVSDSAINNNAIVGNTSLGLDASTATSTVDASANWWGDATGPYHDPQNTSGTGNAVTDYVQFFPYYTNVEKTTLSDIPPVYNVTQDTYFETIQAAIDNADADDIINVSAGTYQEQVTIDADITLVGAGSANTTILCPDALADKVIGPNTTRQPIVYIDSANPTIQNLKIDARNASAVYSSIFGIGLNNAGGEIDDVAIVGNREGDNKLYSAIEQQCTTGPALSLNIHGCDIDNFYRYGVRIQTSETDVSFAITECEITGAGAGAMAQLPIKVQKEGNALSLTGTISSNTISDVIDDGGWAQAITLGFCDDVVLENNTFSNVGSGIYAMGSGVTITGNTIPITASGSQTFGILLTNAKNYEAGATIEANISDNTITLAAGEMGTSTFGVYVQEGLSTDNDNLSIDMENNIIQDFYIGVYLVDAGTNGTITNMECNYSNISNNGFGFYNYVNGLTADATSNWWGDFYGPVHTSNPFNTSTSGNAVSDNVTFMPWFTSETITPATANVTLVKDDGSKATYEVFTTDDLNALLPILVDNDIVVLGSATFDGDFTFDDDITIQAASGATPVITGTVTIASDGITLNGITIDADAGDPAIVVDSAVDGSTIAVNNGTILGDGASGEVAVDNNSGVDINLDGNWWGSATPDFADLIEPDPAVSPTYSNSAPISIYVSATESLIKDEETQTYSVIANDVEDLYSFTVQIKFLKADFDAPVWATDFALGGDFTGMTYFNYVDDSDVTYYMYTVTGGLLGPVNGITDTDVTLFTVDITSSTDANNLLGSLVELPFAEVVLKDHLNGNITCDGTTGKLITIDSVEPTMIALTETSGETLAIDPVKTTTNGYPSVVDTFLGLDFSDNYNLDYARFLIQLQSVADPTAIVDFSVDITTAIDGTAWADAAWQIPDNVLNAAIDDLADGDYTIFLLMTDDAGNFDIWDWDFSIDKTAPDPITWEAGDFCRPTADSNNSIDLDWTDPVSGVTNIHIWYYDYANLTDATGYPEYATPSVALATWPNPYDVDGVDDTDPNWIRITDADDGADYTWSTVPARGYYYFAVYVEDAAGVMSTHPATYGESISYWLGDVNATPDNAVDSDDIALLSAVWGTDGSGNPAIDVGPTTDGGRHSLPTPDDTIDIEDLMMFAMNYENTDYTSYSKEKNQEITPIKIELEYEQIGSQIIAQLILNNNSAFVKGLNIPLSYGAILVLESVQYGDIWPENSFIIHTNIDNTVEVSGSVLGSASCIEGNGVIATITFQVSGQNPSLELQHMIARTFDNEEIEIEDNPESTDENPDNIIPINSILGANYPNPFNPTTTISYGLKEETNVNITLYNIRGQKVRTLINEIMPAGQHQITWNGKDNSGKQAASGVYFYRMKTNDYTKVRKAMLLK
jgi:parallel beta-helix repeat protein